MSENENMKPDGAPMADKNPFPGLSSFSEADAEKFFGRADETAELLRMVKREVLTVVFGRSGLGKTSLLQAGLVPLLRQSGFLPVCIRLNFVDQSQDVAAQVKTAVQRECAAQRVDLQFSELRDDTAVIKAGASDEPAFRDPESSGAPAMTLWEFFHRALFWNQRNELLTPVLLFDQFEEIFTVGNDHAAVPRFIEEISDLIENRIPASERSRGAESLGFAYDKRNFKVIVSLREDFLPSLEELTKDIPSFSTNRMRLICLTGEQALTAVSNPAAGVFDEKVSRSIVKLVAAAQASSASSAKTAELKDMSVEPALLGVVCRELYARYLEDSELVVAEEELGKLTRDILQGFYKRCVNGLPVATRVFIEERLLTRNGYRATVALEDALSSGEISSECINQLVDRRLLRVADRFGTQYLELTHDVLTKVILASRDRRRASEQAETLRRERDQARRKVRRMAVLTSVMAVLTLLTVGLGVFATAKSQQAKAKSDEASKAMKHAERAYDNSLHQLNRLIRLTGRRNLMGANDIQLATEFFDATDKLSPGGKLRLAGYTNLADVLAIEGNTEKALEWYSRGIGLARGRRGVRDEVDWNHALWICYQREGDIHLANGDTRSALASYQEALQISAAEETNAPAPSRAHWLSRRGDTLSSEALAQFEQGANSPAALSLSAAIDLAKQATKRLSDDLEMQRKLAAKLDQLADLWIETGNSNAQKVAIEAFVVRTNFIAGLTNGAPAADRSSLAGTYERLADIALGSGSNSVALSNLNLATSIRTNLLREELLNFDWWRLGARIFEKRALAFIEGNNSTAAFDAYDRALQWRERFWRQDTNNAIAARDYAKTLIVYADLLRTAGKKTNSAAAARQALDLIDHLKEFYVRPNSTNLIWLQELADACESVAVSQALMNETNAAHAEFTKAIECREELCRRDEKNDRFKFKRAVTLGRAADFYITGGPAMTNAGFACANAERQLLDDLYKNHPEYLPYGQMLGNAYKRLGTLYGKMAENVPALKQPFLRLALTNHLNALAVRERIYTNAPDYEKWWHGLALCYGRAGETYLEVCDFDEKSGECMKRAETNLLAEYKWLERLHINDTNNSTWKFSLAQNYRRKAELEAKRGAGQKAVENLALADRLLTNLLATADYKEWLEEKQEISDLRAKYTTGKDAPVASQSN